MFPLSGCPVIFDIISLNFWPVVEMFEIFYKFNLLNVIISRLDFIMNKNKIFIALESGIDVSPQPNFIWKFTPSHSY